MRNRPYRIGQLIISLVLAALCPGYGGGLPGSLSVDPGVAREGLAPPLVGLSRWG
jgi:hypothetical protein